MNKSSFLSIKYDKKEIYKHFDNKFREIDEEAKTTAAVAVLYSFGNFSFDFFLLFFDNYFSCFICCNHKIAS